MSECVGWVIKMDIKDGKLNEFKSLMSEMVEATKKNEPGALSYEWYFNEAETQCQIYEKYTSSQATMIHLGAFGENFAERFMSSVKPTGVDFYGSPSDELREAMKGFGPAYFTHVGGFTR